MFPSKPAPTSVPILDVIANRWSPRAMTDQKIDEETIARLYEAARWAPSSSNHQPWHYVYATKDDGKDREVLESLLEEGNAWAKSAYLLHIGFARKIRIKHDGTKTENIYASHDTGAASLAVTLQATSMGLTTHQMAGFDYDNANKVLGVPDDFIPTSMMAISYAGDPQKLSEELREREGAARIRKTREEFVFHGKWKA